MSSFFFLWKVQTKGGNSWNTLAFLLAPPLEFAETQWAQMGGVIKDYPLVCIRLAKFPGSESLIVEEYGNLPKEDSCQRLCISPICPSVG